MQPPAYFAKVEQNASKRWAQLDADPELAGPWHQLFQQVQSPPHVLSELLQNADDAGAKRAVARIVDGEFVFEHDGEDFNAEQFGSLCRFAFSNKRTLHTIGFRGVGFKSIFSLGDEVKVLTPTLAVRFHRSRFTLPIWLPEVGPLEQTAVRVRVADPHRLQELEQSLQQWTTSPVSLLFFRNLTQIEINGQTINKNRLSNGPVPNSEIIALSHPSFAGKFPFLQRLLKIGPNNELTNQVLLVQSEPEAFPEEAINEIRKERNIPETHFPPCKVEIVLGLSGQQKLFVVLPTGAVLDLPFSINAPFLQDPARYGIKEPSVSPTNRWLLERVGRLAAQVLCGWVANHELPLEERAKAYELLPKAQELADDANGRIVRLVRDALLKSANTSPVMILTDGQLAQPGACFGLPHALHSVWDDTQLVRLFGIEACGLLSVTVRDEHRTILKGHCWLRTISPTDVLTTLQSQSFVPPKPSSWPKLHALWSFVVENTNRYCDDRPKKVKMIPVSSEAALYSSEQVVRLPLRRDQLNPDDWNFVTDNAIAVDSDWLEWLSNQRTKQNEQSKKEDNPALVLLRELGLGEATPIDKIVAAASRKVFRCQSVPLENCVRFAHVLAALGATVPQDFQYATRDQKRKSNSSNIVYDPGGEVEDLVSAEWAVEHILHNDYTAQFKSCTAQAWETWIKSGKSGLHSSLPIITLRRHFWGPFSFEEYLKSQGFERPQSYPYSGRDIDLEDWCFDDSILRHWQTVVEVRTDLPLAVMTNILKGPTIQWSNRLCAEPWQNGRKYRERVSCSPIPATWIVLFRSKACLPDTHGVPRHPAELMLRTPDTEPLRDIEPFVDARLDTSSTRPLLEFLGVRSAPSSPTRVLERLESLSKVPTPLRLVVEINRLYEALDRIVSRCSPSDLKIIVDRFSKVALILSETAVWVTSGEISIFSDGDNQAPSIHHAFQCMPMWPRLGVAEKPAFERSLEWLKSLPSGERIDASFLARVRTLLRREPQRVWLECHHWISLDQTWEPVKRLANRQTMHNLAKWEGLSPAVKRTTADLRILSEANWQQRPFAELQDLGDVVEFRVTEVREAEGNLDKPWLTELGKGLCHVVFEDEVHMTHIRQIAERLGLTIWKPFSRLEVTPYVDGTPAGTPIAPRVLWQDTTLYVAANVSVAKLHKELADELARPFGDRAVQEAITACIEHDSEYVAEYLADQFELEEQLSLFSSGHDNATAGEQVSVGKENKAGTDTERTDETATFTSEIGGSGSSTDDDGHGDGKSDTEDSANETEAVEGTGLNNDETNTTKARNPSAPPKPDLMDRYAAKHGFKWHLGEKCYYHQDGRWIEKADSPFHWVEMTAEGQPMLRLWVQEQTLSHGLELPAEIWSLIRSEPKTSAMLVKDNVEAPVSLMGDELVKMQAEKLILLYPSRYRIVENNV